jgi:hypothetical protein
LTVTDNAGLTGTGHVTVDVEGGTPTVVTTNNKQTTTTPFQGCNFKEIALSCLFYMLFSAKQYS